MPNVGVILVFSEPDMKNADLDRLFLVVGSIVTYCFVLVCISIGIQSHILLDHLSLHFLCIISFLFITTYPETRLVMRYRSGNICLVEEPHQFKAQASVPKTISATIIREY
jgi:hypothetical protein